MNRTLTINGRLINDDGDCYVIAELGHNHQGSVDTAKRMIEAAADCGVDAVKLQKRDNRTLFVRSLYASPYENENSYGPTYGAHREALEFGRAEYRELIDFAGEKGLSLFATAFDFPSADFLADLDVPAYKTASGDLTNTPLLAHVAAIGKPMIVSTGGGNMDDIRRAYDTIMPINPQLCILQCTAAYPIEKYEDMNLAVIPTLREAFPENVIGLSDHESGITMALAAYMLGARVVEKHFTLNRAWRGTDHAFSLNPQGLRRLVRNFSRARTGMGDGVKRRLPCEEKPLYKMSKSLVAARALPGGIRLAREDVAIKSPGGGLPPYELETILGRTLKEALPEDGAFSLDMLD